MDLMIFAPYLVPELHIMRPECAFCRSMSRYLKVNCSDSLAILVRFRSICAQPPWVHQTGGSVTGSLVLLSPHEPWLAREVLPAVNSVDVILQHRAKVKGTITYNSFECVKLWDIITRDPESNVSRGYIKEECYE